MAPAISACTPLFVVSKGKKRGVHLESNSKATDNVLCASGDLKEVLLSKEKGYPINGGTC